MNCRDRCATDEYDSVIRRLEAAENKNLDQDNAIDAMGKTIPDFNEVDTLKIDVSALKNNVVVLSNEKLDKDNINKDLHFGEITLTREGTAVMASLEVLNPVTGVITPISFTIPGATSEFAGVMPADEVAWIADAEERISMLEGLSDVNAVEGLDGDPSQSSLTSGWISATGKNPEKGDILQDLDNGKLWVFGGVDWTLMGEVVYMPMASTTALGGVRDTSLTAEGNRWYIHVESDGRMALIGGDALSTLIDTTVPAMQTEISTHVGRTDNPHSVTKDQIGLGSYPASPANLGISTATQNALDGTVKKTGDTITGDLRIANDGYGILYLQTLTNKRGPTDSPDTDVGGARIHVRDRNNKEIGAFNWYIDSWSGRRTRCEMSTFSEDATGAEVRGNFTLISHPTAGSYATFPMRETPGASDVVYTKYVLDRVSELVGYVDDTAVKKGSTINVGDGIVQKDIDPSDWQRCETSNTTNFVVVSGPARGLNALISETGSGVAGMYTRVAGIGDAGNESGSSSISFLVPKNWYYKIETPGSTSRTPRAVEHPITL